MRPNGVPPCAREKTLESRAFSGAFRCQVRDFLAGCQQVNRLEDDVVSPVLLTGSEDEVDAGEWKYIVLDPKGVTLRSHATYEKAAKLKDRLEEGEVVSVLERRDGADTVGLSRVESESRLRSSCVWRPLRGITGSAFECLVAESLHRRVPGCLVGPSPSNQVLVPS